MDENDLVTALERAAAEGGGAVRSRDLFIADVPSAEEQQRLVKEAAFKVRQDIVAGEDAVLKEIEGLTATVDAVLLQDAQLLGRAAMTAKEDLVMDENDLVTTLERAAAEGGGAVRSRDLFIADVPSAEEQQRLVKEAAFKVRQDLVAGEDAVL